ncbi:hypothetical protein DPMN_141753 [Dreissena polymorpha]|uniref:Uncharacterized protein n=1 Tax=Dreissena polymorpha TaxID=45954 RepID=A0A9D4GCZ0_DREPO|nr:hypothetical protein DPMN_141753 [Dreissena polymorpha]
MSTVSMCSPTACHSNMHLGPVLDILGSTTSHHLLHHPARQHSPCGTISLGNSCQF